MEPINIAFAGVGKPIKLVVCLSSILNFAKRNAENKGIKNATKGTNFIKLSASENILFNK